MRMRYFFAFNRAFIFSKSSCCPFMILCQLTKLLMAPNVYKNLHRPAADHALFARFFRRQLEMVKGGCAAAHRLARFGPDLCFDAAAADRSGDFARFEEEHFRAATLRRRAARVRDRRDDDSFIASLRFAD